MNSIDDTTDDAPDTGARSRSLASWLRVLPPLWARAASEAMQDEDDPDDDDPRAAWRRASAAVQDRIAETVSADDLAVTVATLEAVARELGYDEERMPRGRGRRAFGPWAMGGSGPMGFGPMGGFGPWSGGRRFGGFGPFGFGPFGFGPSGFGPRGGFGPGFARGVRGDHGGDCGSRAEHGHRHGSHEHDAYGRKGRHHGERSYERGFTAGFDAARRGEAPAPRRDADGDSAASRTEAPVA